MAAAATARRSTPVPTQAPRRKPPRKPRAAAPRARPRQAQAARLMRPAVAGAALFPQAAVRSAGAVRDFSDSGLIMRLTRGRGWIAVLGTLLVGIVALNVVSLSLSAGSGRLSLQIDALKTEISSLNAQIEERLSAGRVQQEAARLGLAVPDPKAITYLSANDGDAARLAHMLGTDSFLMAPSVPSSYPASGVSYAPSPASSPTATTAPATSTTGTTATTTTPTTPSAVSGSAGAAPATSGTSSGSSGASTGGVGL